jgi:YbbR-like protein
MLQNPLNKKQYSFLKNKNIKMFLFFIFLSFTFWLLINLSKESINVAKFNVTYYNLPKAKVFQDKPQSSLNLEIKTHGFNFLTYQLNPKSVKINLAHLQYFKGNTYIYLPNNYLRDFQSQFSQKVEMLSVGVDTLFFKLTTNAVKKVKIKPNLKVNFKMGYNYIKPIKIEPDSVEIEGPKAWLDSINEVVTDDIVLNDLSKNTTQTAALKKAKNSKLKYNISSVILNVYVDKFTETSLVTGFDVINVPPTFTITTIPKEVTVKYQVSLTNFNKVTPSLFKIVCNYAFSSKDSLPYLIPQIVEKPSYVKGVTVSPKRIEYLIKK